LDYGSFIPCPDPSRSIYQTGNPAKVFGKKSNNKAAFTILKGVKNYTFGFDKHGRKLAILNSEEQMLWDIQKFPPENQ
jgi:hypothetical protein